jgi:hypothetical protein
VIDEQKKGLLDTLAAPAQKLITLAALIGLLFTGFTYVRNGLPDAAGTNQLRVEITNNLKSQTDGLLNLKDQLQDFTGTITENSKVAATQRDELKRSVDGLIDRVIKLEKVVNTDINPAPAIRFYSVGNKIESLIEDEPIRIGDFVRLTYSYNKLRDCGKSEPDDLLVDMNGVIAHFERVSVLDPNGKGLSTPVDPTLRNEITYTAQIPPNVGLVAGPAVAYVSITYDHEKCPAVDVIESPRIPFTLSPSINKKVENDL